MVGLKFATDVVFFLDVALNFVTGYAVGSAAYELDMKKAALRYLNSWFALDLIAAMPLEYIYGAFKGGLTGLSNTERKTLR